MSEEKIAEGEGKATTSMAKLSERFERAQVGTISRVKVEKYNEKGELYETIVEELE